jgi:hypothetical protein
MAIRGARRVDRQKQNRTEEREHAESLHHGYDTDPGSKLREEST